MTSLPSQQEPTRPARANLRTAKAKVDFKALNDRALLNLDAILEEFLGLDTKQVGKEIQMINPRRNDGEFGSFSVNSETGVYADFADDVAGSDIVNLVAYILEIKQGEAARRLTSYLDDLDAKRPSAATMPLKIANQGIKNATILIEPPGTKPEPEVLKPAVAASVARPGEKIPPLAPSLPAFGQPKVIYPYRDAQCLIVGAVCRYERDGKKDFRPFSLRRARAGDPLHWKAGTPDGLRPLFGLELLAAKPKAVVVIVEGEKAADAAGRMLPDTVAVTSMNGAQSARMTDMTPLRGRRVLIWPDNDRAGHSYAKTVAGLLQQQGNRA